MDFTYEIKFWSEEGGRVTRHGSGMFYPSDVSFQLEHMLWLMAEEFGRPTHIEIIMEFTGEGNGKNTSKRLEGPKAEA